MRVSTAIRYWREALRVIRQGSGLRDRLILAVFYAKWPFIFMKALVTRQHLRAVEAMHPRLVGNVSLRNSTGTFFCGQSIMTVYIADEQYERELRAYLTTQSGTFIDVGAHIGKYTVMNGRNPAVNVIALEPEAMNFAILNRNVQLNNLHRVSTLNIGAWSEKTALKLSTRTAGSGEHSFIGGDGNILVDVDTLDNVVAGFTLPQPVSLIKIDVEGSEVEVLKGATEILMAHHPKLVIETHTVSGLMEVTNLLRRFGYSARALDAFNYLFE
jgi:FkbM family methyltransferase